MYKNWHLTIAALQCYADLLRQNDCFLKSNTISLMLIISGLSICGHWQTENLRRTITHYENSGFSLLFTDPGASICHTGRYNQSIITILQHFTLHCQRRPLGLAKVIVIQVWFLKKERSRSAIKPFKIRSCSFCCLLTTKCYHIITYMYVC